MVRGKKKFEGFSEKKEYKKTGSVRVPNIEARLCSYCCSGKAISVKYSECVFVDLGSMHAMPLRHIVTLTCPSLQHFSTLSHKRHDFFFFF
jgi:hypothetical protein